MCLSEWKKIRGCIKEFKKYQKVQSQGQILKLEDKGCKKTRNRQMKMNQGYRLKLEENNHKKIQTSYRTLRRVKRVDTKNLTLLKDLKLMY